MFIPFSQLSNFIDQLIGDLDITIYHHENPGSKLLGDIKYIKDYDSELNWMQSKTNFSLIMHDQEPLLDDYSFFADKNQVLKLLENISAFLFSHMSKQNNIDWYLEFIKGSEIWITKGENINDKFLICHSELNSLQLEKLVKIGGIGVYWWSHAMIARDWYRYAMVDKRIIYTRHQFDKDFNIYNRAWTGTREYRLKFTDLLIEFDLVKNSNVKFSPYDDGQHYLSHNFKNKLFIPKNSLETLPNSSCVSSCASADYSWHDYQNFGIDVVLETIFDDQRIHLTEKTLRPIACGKPFILLAGPGSLKYLRNYGFKTFSNIIDESYDEIDDSMSRMTAIIKEMKRISNQKSQDKKLMYREIEKICLYNKEKFWSTEFYHQLIDEFQNNLKSALIEAKLYQTGKYFKELRKLLIKNIPECREKLSSTNEIRTRKDIIDLFLKINSTNFDDRTIPSQR